MVGATEQYELLNTTDLHNQKWLNWKMLLCVFSTI